MDANIMANFCSPSIYFFSNHLNNTIKYKIEISFLIFQE